MTPADLASRGRILFGPCWQTPLAAALGVARRTLLRWLAEERGMPTDLGARLDAIAKEREAEIRESRKKVRRTP